MKIVEDAAECRGCRSPEQQKQYALSPHCGLDGEHNNANNAYAPARLLLDLVM
jgi:hypothetical protein